MGAALRFDVPDDPESVELQRVLASEPPEAATTTITGLGPGGLRLTAVTEGRPQARVGDTIHVALPPRPAAWYAHSGERIG